MDICLILNERPVLNRLRPVRTSNRSRPVLIGFLWSLIGPVQFFEVLGLWWTGLGLGLSPWRSKTETGPDFQSLLLHTTKFRFWRFLDFNDGILTFPSASQFSGAHHCIFNGATFINNNILDNHVMVAEPGQYGTW